MKTKLVPFITMGLLLLFATARVGAGITTQEAERLGKDLTPMGAEKAGNKDGSIPEWSGGMTRSPAGFDIKNGYTDPYAGEKPLFTITAENAEKYRDKLSAGHLALFKKYPKTYRMNVYPSHRTAALPQKAYDDIKKFSTQAELSQKGNWVKNSGTSSVPFPIPKRAEELMWNVSLHWHGGGVERIYDWVTVQPNGEFYKVRVDERWYKDAHGYVEGASPERLISFYVKYLSPATLEGTTYLIWEPFNQDEAPRQAWVYNVGQRRVRRAPDVAYDFVAEGTEGLRFSDNYDGWNGKLDRYNWKIVGKKEMYVPYNAYKMADKKLKYADMHKPGHLNPDIARYELHRAWVIEANLKEGQRHVIGKRTFYLDEDTWQVSAADLYDTRGQLWRMIEGHMMQYYDAQVPWYTNQVIMDLNSGAYISNFLSNEVTDPWKFGAKSNMNFLNPDNLRRLGNK